jgi:pimeloyl-ACP methyl ester carboxylesterase
MRTHRRFLTAADGSRLAWDVAGEGEHTGRPPVLLCNGLITNTIFWRNLLPDLEARHTVVSWDLKGHGDSGPARTPAGATIAAAADDALAVLDAAGLREAVVFGFSMGCQVAAEIHRRAPGRVRALAFVFGPVGPVFETAFGPFGPVLGGLTRATHPRVLMAILHTLSRLGQPPIGHFAAARLGLIGPTMTPDDLAGILSHWRQLDGPTVRRLALDAGTFDARPHLPSIRVPTLVLCGDRDVFAPPRKVGLPLHAALPGATLVRLPHGTHSSTLEHTDDVRAALLDFLDGVLSAPA